ncbi:MAG: Ig-like domain repeat protein [Clostridia bacterium]|nr:Ig-like domain repeat protein [Clostridia bacterium]
MIDAQTGEHILLTDENAASYGVTNWASITDAMKTHTFGVASARIPTLARSGYTMTKWFYADNTALNGTYKDQLGAAVTYYNSPYHADNPKVELREDGKYYIVVHTTATLNAGYKITLGVNGGKFVLDGVEDTTSRTVTHTSDKDTILNTTESNLSKDFDTIYKTGYEFVGWNNGTAYNAGIRYSSEMHKIPKWSVPETDVLYAEWKPNTFTVKYYIDGIELTDDNYTFWGITDYAGSAYMPRTHTYGKASDNDDQLASAAYTISPWYYNPDFTGSVVKTIAADAFSYDANGRDYVIKLYAYSTPKQYAHRMYPNGGTFTLTAGGTYTDYKAFTTTYNEVGDLTTLFTALERPGYTFIGWNTVKDGTGDYVSYEKFSLPANTFDVADSFYAIWEPDTFPIEYYVDGKLLTKELADEMGIINYDTIIATDTHTYGTATVLTRVQRTGYTSTARWSYDPSGTPIIADHTITKNYCSYDANGEDYVIKVYSVTTPDDVQVVFRTPDGTSVGATNLNAYFGIDNAWPMVDYDQTYVLPTETLRPGYHLAGFYSDTACTKRIYEVNPADFITTYNRGTEYTNYNVYVKWEKEETTVPTGSIDLGVGATGVSTEFIEVDDIRYGIYAQSYPNVTIIGDKDSTNYVPPKVEYFLVENGTMTLDEVVNVNDDRWIPAENGVPFSLEGTPDGEYVMYVRLTDDQGNENFISSQRFVIDNVAPDFVELEGGEYCFNEDLESELAGGYTFTVVEKYPDKITINDDVQTFVQLQLENDYTLPGSEGGADYTVYAKDKAGNETTVTVKIYNCHNWTEWYIENAEDCLNDGNDRRDCQRCGEIDTQVRPALGHDWEATTYTFTDDGKSCVAVRICNRDASHVESETATVDNGQVTFERTTEPTCIDDGETTYTADFVADWAPENPTKTVADIDSLGHTEGEVVVENNVDPKCIETGSYDNVVYCTVCKVELSRDTVTVPATDHKWGKTTYVWDGYTKCTATRICEYQTGIACTETETTENITDEVTIPLVCNDDGERTYTAHFVNEWAGESTTTEVIPAEPDNVNVHEEPELTIVEDTATCIKDGEKTIYWECQLCGLMGEYTEFSPATGHNWGETVYTWNWEAEDGKVICTATRKCSNNTTAECEQAKPSEATAVEDTYVAPNCTEAGSEDYYAPFDDEHDWTEPQTETKVIPALGHTDGEPVEDATTLKKAECGKDGSVDVVKHCTVCGVETYRQAQRIPTIQSSEQGGHTWSEWIVSKPATYFEAGEEYRYCTNAEIFGNPDRFIDCCSKETREIPALKDSTVPEVSVTAPDHAITDTKVDYDKDGTAVTITASDADSGLKSVTYTVTKDGVVIETVEAEIADGKVNVTYPVNINGEYVITVTAVDKLNNERTVASDRIVIDNVAPDATLTPSASVSNEKVTVTVEATDNLSGIKDVEYYISTTPVEDTDTITDWNYVTDGAIAVEAEGDNYVYVKVTDNAGNEKIVPCDKITLDYTDPTIRVTVTDADNTANVIDSTTAYNAAPENKFTNEDALVTIERESENDTVGYITVVPYTGTVLTEEELDALEGWTEGLTTELTGDGKYVVYVKTTDEAGNTVYVNTNVIVIDTEKPVISEDLEELYCATESVTFFAGDNYEGVTVEIDGVKIEADVNGGYTVCGNDGTPQTIKVTDLAGNVTEFVIQVYKNHTPGETVIENNVDPTCTTEGSYDNVVYCTVCKAELSRETVTVPMLAHTAGEPVVENEKAATCTTDGSYDIVVYCTVCDAELSRKTEKVPAKGHTAGEWVVESNTPATCTENGAIIKAQYCTVCNEKLDETVQILPKTGHDYEVTDHKDATCTEDGYDVYTCKNDASHTYTVKIDKLGHDEIAHEAKAPTCTEIGWDAYVTCSRCDYTTYVELPANGHPQKHGFKEVIVKEMTDNKDGTYSDGLYYVIEYCKVCDHVFSKTEYTLHPVAQNVESGKLYTTLEEALNEALAGNTVKLVDDLCGDLSVENVLATTPGYLDLNGHILETNTISAGFSTHIIDTSVGNKGHLIVESENQKINPSNCDLPIYVAYTAADGTVKDAYRFFDNIKLQQLTPEFTTDTATGSKFVSVTFRPIIDDTATTKELFADGAADNHIKFGVVFKVTKADGTTSEMMHWICQDSLVKTVYTNNRAFMVTLTGIEAYQTITIGSVLISEDLGVEMTTYEKNGEIISTIGTYDIATGKAIEA